MPGIICAIRGGPASRPTIEKSIQLAAAIHEPIYFLYVVNLDFLSRTTSSRVHHISKQMHEMGEFILLTAQAEAQTQGIKTEGIVRQGNVRDEIVALCQEKSADYVILGKPKTHSADENVFNHERLDKFVQRIADEGGAKIVMAEM